MVISFLALTPCCFYIPVWKCCCWWGKKATEIKALLKNKWCFCCVLYWRFAGKQSWAAHQCLHSSNHEKWNTCMCTSCQKCCISCSLCTAEEINVAFNPDQLKKHLYLQDLWIRGGDFLLMWWLRSNKRLERKDETKNTSDLIPWKMCPRTSWVNELVILVCPNHTSGMEAREKEKRCCCCFDLQSS